MFVNKLSLNIHPESVGQANGCRELGWTTDSCAQKASSAHHMKHQQLAISRGWMKGKDPNMHQIFCLLLGSPQILHPYSAFCCKVSIHKQLFEALIVTLFQMDLIWNSSLFCKGTLYYILQNTYYHGPFQNRFLTSNLIWYLWHFVT